MAASSSRRSSSASRAGLRATNGHQNAENPAPTTQFSTGVSLGPVELLGAGGRRLRTVAIGGWRGVGAASGSAGTAGGAVQLRFSDSGMPGVVRPPQPSDSHPIPVLADPRAAAAATAGGQIALTVDGLPVNAHVVGVLRRFPTIASGGAGFIVADEATLAAALDASLPGQGRARRAVDRHSEAGGAEGGAEQAAAADARRDLPG